MDTRALGGDYSKWDDDNSTPQQVDFVKALTAGTCFTFIKASQNNWVDEDFIWNWKKAKDAGLLRGAYHFLDWGVSADIQMATFTGLLKSDPGELPPVLDAEHHSSLIGTTLEGRVALVKKCLLLIQDKTGKLPMIYSGYYTWKENMTPDPYWKQYPYWLPWYNNDESIVRPPEPWTEWDFWQFTDKATGSYYGSEALELDMNRYKGTREQLFAWAGISLPPTPPPHPDFCPTCGQAWPVKCPDQTPSSPTHRVKAGYNLNIHYPGQYDPVIGLLMAGTQIKVIDSTAYYAKFEPFASFPKGGWVYKAYLEKL